MCPPVLAWTCPMLIVPTPLLIKLKLKCWYFGSSRVTRPIKVLGDRPTSAAKPSPVFTWEGMR